MKIGRHCLLGAALVLAALGTSPAYAGGKDDGKEVVIRIEVDGDEVSVTRNGLPVSPESIFMEDGELVIRGDEGETMLLALPRVALREDLLHFPPLPARGLRIGVWLEPVEPALAAHAGVEPNRAILVTRVEDGGPADRAGLRRYDLITEVDGERVRDIRDVRRALEEMEEGEHLALTVRRAGERVDLDVVPELRDLGPVRLSAELEDEDLEGLLEAMPMLESLDRRWYFAPGEEDDLALIGPDVEREIERAHEEAMRAREEAMRAQEEAMRAREEALREVEERLRAIEKRLERMEEER